MLVDIGYVARMTRASMAEVMSSGYVRTAILKGLPYRRVIVRHAPSQRPPRADLRHPAPHRRCSGGIVVVESLFGFHGFGKMMLDASLNKDVAVIEAGAMVAIAIAVGTQLLADVLYRAQPADRLA